MESDPSGTENVTGWSERFLRYSASLVPGTHMLQFEPSKLFTVSTDVMRISLLAEVMTSISPLSEKWKLVRAGREFLSSMTLPMV